MKSGRQRREEIQVRRADKRAAARAEEKQEEARKREKELKGEAHVNPANLRPTNSFGIPNFVSRGYYVDMPFKCKACGKAQIWTAMQQKWWYECAKGDVWTIAVLCRPCRIRERERKAAARKVHLEGLARKGSHET